MLWMPRGTRRKVPVTPPGRTDPGSVKDRTIENLARGDWVHGDHVWDVSTLWLVRPGDWHSVWVSWLESGAHFGWYINLQQPYRRTELGIEAMDLMLDVVAEPDLTWRWKDEDEFDELLARGVFDTATGLRVSPRGGGCDRPHRSARGTLLRTVAGLAARPGMAPTRPPGWMGRGPGLAR